MTESHRHLGLGCGIRPGRRAVPAVFSKFLFLALSAVIVFGAPSACAEEAVFPPAPRVKEKTRQFPAQSNTVPTPRPDTIRTIIVENVAEQTFDVPLPDIFIGVDIDADAAKLFSADGEGGLEACSFDSYSAVKARLKYSCRPAVGNEYSFQLRGFVPITLSLIGNAEGSKSEGERLQVGNFLSDVTVRIVQNTSGKGSSDAPAPQNNHIETPLNENWIDIVDGNGAKFVEKTFSEISKEPSIISKYCKIKNRNEFTLPAIISGDGLPSVELTCQLQLLDVAGLPSEPERFLPKQCIGESRNGAVCVVDDDLQDAEGTGLTGEPGPPWRQNTVEKTGLSPIRLADQIFLEIPAMSEKNQIAVPLGDKNVVYELLTATVGNDNGECPQKIEISKSGIGAFRDVPFSSFGCSANNVVPTRANLEFGLVRGEDAQIANLNEKFAYTLDLTGGAPPAIDLSSIVAAATLVVNLPPNAEYELFSLQLFSDQQACSSLGTKPVFETAMTARNNKIALDEKRTKTIAGLVARLFDGANPLTKCAPIEVRLREEKSVVTAALEFEAQSLRPSGPSGLLVLSPTSALRDQAWRDPIISAVKDWAVSYQQEKPPVGVDFIEVLENRKPRTVFSAEDLQLLPQTGGSDSLIGRLDLVSFEARVGRPLSDLNVVQQRMTSVLFSKALVIVDSTQESFDPRDSGAFFYWLVNRKISVRLLSLSGCEKWLEFASDAGNHVQCIDLATINKSQVERKAMIVESLDWLLERG